MLKRLATVLLFVSIVSLALWLGVPWWSFSLILGVDVFVCCWIWEEEEIGIRIPVMTFFLSMCFGLAAFAVCAGTGDSFTTLLEDRSLSRRVRHLPEYSLVALSFSICAAIVAVVEGMREQPREKPREAPPEKFTVRTKPVVRNKDLAANALSPVCIEARKFLSAEPYRDLNKLALWFIERLHGVQSESSDASAAVFDHVQLCTSCRGWFNSVVPEQVFVRESRMRQYCCASMYAAVEEGEHGQTNRFTHSLIRGKKSCWQIDGKNSFARYCPWCGKKLPAHPFVESAGPR